MGIITYVLPVLSPFCRGIVAFVVLALSPPRRTGIFAIVALGLPHCVGIIAVIALASCRCTGVTGVIAYLVPSLHWLHPHHVSVIYIVAQVY
jgi:hypothetical protein